MIALALTLGILAAIISGVALAGNGPECEAIDGLLNAAINSAIDDQVINENVLYNYFDAASDCNRGG